MRLNQFLARAGVASRRKADELIKQGKVKINQQVVATLGVKVADGDEVEVDGKLVTKPGKYVYYAVNKPVGYVSSLFDPLGRPCVVELVPANPKVYPVGRLDIDTSGLIILTNDGDFTFRMTHPKNEVTKTYEVRTKNVITDAQIEKLCRGIKLNDGITHPAQAVRLSASTLELTIHEGRNRQIRRMMGAINHEVKALKRIREGEIPLGNLAPGEYRIISIE